MKKSASRADVPAGIIAQHRARLHTHPSVVRSAQPHPVEKTFKDKKGTEGEAD